MIWEENLDSQFERPPTFGEKVSDKTAKFGGSWKFIISFGCFILGWCILNALLADRGWDPYPFILLNLCLSMLAAVQAPLIMMAQNRQDEKDRARSEYDYKVNMQAELQVRHLNAKIDHLITNQCRKMLEMQVHLIKSQKQILSKGKGKQKFWQIELKQDPLCEMLLNRYYSKSVNSPLVFEDRFSGGDNFVGNIAQVEVIPSAAALGDPFKLVFDLNFGNQFATLDAVLAGEGRVSIRNCFQESGLEATGSIETLNVCSKDNTVRCVNGKLPPRYKWTLSKDTAERLHEFWRMPLTKLQIDYLPAQFLATHTLEQDRILMLTHITFFPTIKGEGTRLMMATDLEASEVLPDLGNPKWKELRSCSWSASQVVSGSPILVPLEIQLEGPHKYFFFVTIGQALLTGELHHHENLDE